MACPNRESPGLHRDPHTRTLQAVRFADNKVPELNVGIGEELQASNSLATVVRGYSLGVVEPTIMLGFKPTGPVRVFLEVITASPGGITPEQWKQTATVCPPDWPTDYSLLRLWHYKQSLRQFAALLNEQLEHRHMFSHWVVNLDALAGRVLYQSPANYFPDTALQEHWRTFDFPSRMMRRRPTKEDKDAFPAKCAELRRSAAEQEQRTPVSYALENSWTATLRADKRYYLDNTSLRTT